MRLQETLATTLSKTPSTLDKFKEHINPEWIQQALEHTGKTSIRKRKLPAEHIVWLVIGSALYRNSPIWYITEQLALTLDGKTCVPSATVQARQRLGHQPLQQLFKQLSSHWQQEQNNSTHNFNGLTIQAVDGVVFYLPYTQENLNYFGSAKGKTADTPYPQARSVCLINTQTHEIIDSQISEMSNGEVTLAKELTITDNTITIFDRAYFSADLLIHWQQAQANSHWLMRAKDKLRYEVIKTFAKGDYLIQMPVSPQAQNKNPSLPNTWQARLIEYEYQGKLRRYITSLLDPKQFAKKEVAMLYIERWEIEMCYRELKADLQAGLTLRSKLPDLVLQELWGLLIAYNFIRRMMRFMAMRIQISPLRLSFHLASIAIVDLLKFAPLTSAGNFPKLLEALLNMGNLFVIPERRKGRSNPRVVKGRPQKYQKKYANLS